MDIRVLQVSDVPLVQHANIENLPENYFLKYHLYHALSWPQLSFVAVDVSRPEKTPYDYPKIVGYVLAKMEEEPADGIKHGHITSLSVMRTHRRLGIAEKLMRQSQQAMVETYGAEYVSLHVRISNKAAIHLYRETLGFKTDKIEAKYYADGEDAFSMRLDLKHIRQKLDAAADNNIDNAGAETSTAGADAATTENIDEGDPVGDVASAQTAAAVEAEKKEMEKA
ncbi:hypothetical protein TD95_005390 [Thielaviopsis punctulata]|uniref:N-acetyltransferase domain-containing protein n=1 Tax=Thielaviopsis punctulata TaxID=72032 RepID=A0A0F4Z9J8_9PEZI|nr:hypothetical protein TD95_005390 [Thielaviopsis punctulata]